MRSMRPIVISSSHKATENQSDMMRMKQNDDSLGRDTTLCGDPGFLSLMKGTLFFNEYNMDVEVTSSIFPQPSSLFHQPSALSPQPSAFRHLKVIRVRNIINERLMADYMAINVVRKK